MTVTEITSLADFKEIISKDEPAIFDFWAPWCGPCRVISPIFERLASETPGLKFYKVNTDDAGDIQTEAGIRAMPTFMVFRKGEKLGTVLGARPGPLQDLIKSHAEKPAPAENPTPA